jgi:hypothetical protein
VQILFNFKVNYNLLIKVAIFIAITLSINIYVSQLSMDWVARFIIAAGGSFAIAFALKLISIRNLIHIVKYEE